MSRSTKILPNYTYDDYINWEGEWEIIDGIPYAMSPMPSPQHQNISVNISAAFHQAIRKNSCERKAYQPIDLKIVDETVVHPDLLVVCQPINKQYLDFPPELVVEILSPSSQLKDKITKLELYQNFGVKYYLIIDPETNLIICYQLTEGTYQEVPKVREFKLTDNSIIQPDLSEIW